MKDKPRRSAMWGRKFLIMCAMIACASLVFARPHSHKISPHVRGKTSGHVRVIVQFNQPVTPVMNRMVIHDGGRLLRRLPMIRAGAYSMPAAAVEHLARNPLVTYISPDAPVHNFATTSGGVPAELDYHNETINAPAAWNQGFDGSGIGVAVIDSGVAKVLDLPGSHIVYSQNFVGDHDSTANDLFGHGTHVTGIIAGNGAGSTGSNYFYTFQGIAPGVNIVNLRVLDANGNGTESGVIAAIQRAIQLKGAYNIRIINLSLGTGVFESYIEDPLCQAVEQAWRDGIVVVVSAGNGGRNNAAGTNGYGTITSPGNDPYVITVGAMNTKGTPDPSDDIPASYSSKGPTLWDQVIKPDIVAPGNMVVSLYTPADTLNQEYYLNEAPRSIYQNSATHGASGEYFLLSGTSMAAPMVSGAVALLLQQTPNLTPDQIKALLMATADKNLVRSAIVTDPVTGQTFPVEADIFTVGAGELDIKAALAAGTTPPPAGTSAMSPFARVDSEGNVVMVIGTPSNGEPVIWGGSVLWGSSVLWGANAAQDESVLWGSSVLWGANTASESVLWGANSLNNESVLWGSNSTDEESVLWGASVLWGTGTSDSNSVLWGAGTVKSDSVTSGSSVLWGANTVAGEVAYHGDKP